MRYNNSHSVFTFNGWAITIFFSDTMIDASSCYGMIKKLMQKHLEDLMEQRAAIPNHIQTNFGDIYFTHESLYNHQRNITITDIVDLDVDKLRKEYLLYLL